MARHSFFVAIAFSYCWMNVSAIAYASNSSFASSAVLTLPSSFQGASTSSPPTSITASPSIPGNNGTCSKYCGFDRIFFSSVYWSQWITPVTVGTVFVVVDDTTNKTTSTTRYNSVTDVIVGSSTLPLASLIGNGIYTPATTTATGTLTGFDSSTTTLTYPTEWYTVYPSIAWAGTIPYEEDSTTTCSTWGAVTAGKSVYFPFSLEPSPLPSHPPWPTPLPPVNSDDPLGNWYTLQDYYEKERLDATDVATLYPSDPFLLEIYGCTTSTAAAAATAVQTVAALLATSTQHVTSPPKTTKEPAEPAKPGNSPTGGQETRSDPIGTPTTPTKKPQAPETQQPNSPLPNNNGNPAEGTTTRCTEVGCFIATGIGANPGPGTTTRQPAGPGAVTTPPAGVTPKFVVGGSTLLPGSTLTVSGTTYSLAETPTAIYVNGESLTIPSNPTAPVTVNGVTITPAAGGSPSSITEFLIGGQTLLPGSSVVVSGTTYSLPTSGTGIYVNGHFTGVPTSGGEGQPFSIGSVAVTPTEVSVPGSPSASYSVVPADANGADLRCQWSWILWMGSIFLMRFTVFA